MPPTFSVRSTRWRALTVTVTEGTTAVEKPWSSAFDPVGADADVEELIGAARLADGRRHDAGGEVGERHRGAGHGGALLVADLAEDGGGVELGVGGGRRQQGDGKEPERKQPALESQHVSSEG